QRFPLSQELMGDLKCHKQCEKRGRCPKTEKLSIWWTPSVHFLTPSAFMKDMNLTTEQKLASTHEMCPPQIIEMMDMSENSYSKLSTVDVDQAIFQPFPSEICFQNYTPCETYEFPLILRNIDKVPRLVKIVEDDSPYFRVISPPDVHNKVAPGMSSTFHILFNPDENKDYSHLLVFMTEREKFVVPIKTIGARAILDFPDHLNFSDCPVKYLSQKTLLVRNIGNRDAKFTLNVNSPFSVSPKISNLGIGESMQVAVDFFPEVNGDHSGELVLHYDTGEDIYISLYGAASDLNVRLSKNTVIIEKTYLSMISQRSVTISNRSDVIVRYQWMAFATPQDEEQLKYRSSLDLQQQEEIEMELFLEECNADPSIREKISILHRSFQHRLRMLQDENIAFVDDVFSLQPAEGEIWPNSTVEINIFFKPKEEKVYQQNIYCDITGRESRLLLRIKGEGIGPKLTFSFDEVDVGHMFIGSMHTYEVLLTNKGFISAVFCLVPPDSAVGACFSFNPSKGIIHPGGFQAIQVELCSKILGVFKEDFYFSVDGSSQNICVTFRGCIVGPTFHFNLPSLNFGDVSFGFPQKLSCQLNNTALVPISFNLRISGDGSGDESVTSFTQVSDLSRTHWKSNKKTMQPREFTVSPSRGAIRAISEMDIEITLCSNTVKQYEVALVVDVDGVGEEILALPIFARCVVPPLCLMSPVLDFKKCFINFPYHNTIKVVNEGCLPACCGLITQENDENSKVEYTSPNPRAVVNPCCVLEIPLVLQAKAVGKHNIMAHVAVFGSREKPFVSCIGKGPVVHVSTMEVDFGNVPVLTNISRTLKLSNQSPIPAFYVDNVKSLWQMEPCEGIIPSEGETEINLVANLDDTVWFQDKIHLTIESSNSHIIPVSARGIGTTIVADRPLAPAIHLGTHFSSGICQYPFKLTNMGRRCHELFWMTEGFSPFRRRIPTFDRSTKGISHLNSKNLENSPNPIFKLYPMTAELFPGQSIDVVLKGTSVVPKEVKERLICKAVLGKHTKKERIMTVDVSCQFIAPVLDVSEKHLSFFVEKQPGQELEAQLRPLVLKNVSVLELSMILTVTEPYSICCTEEDNVALSLSKTVTLEVDQELHLLIQFDPTFHKDKHSWETDESLTIMYADHPQKDYVSIHGEVHFPNLHFSSLEVDFGCILNGTESSKSIEMTNCSPLPVRFCWSVLQDDVKKERANVTQYIAWEEDKSSPGNLVAFMIVWYRTYLLETKKQVCIICEVDEGPTYELSLKGEASLVQYTIDRKEIDYGLQEFDCVAHAEITLKNTGKVNFEFNVLNGQQCAFPENLQPGIPLVLPQSGYIKAYAEQRLSVYYFPGIPETFQKSFDIQVSYFKPDTVFVKGEGIFPRIFLDLPRNLMGKTFVQFSLLVCLLLLSLFTDCLIQMEVERLLIKEHALEQERLYSSHNKDVSDTGQKWRRRCKLPEYYVDFGYVTYGNVCTRKIKVINTGILPASFQIDKQILANTGLSTELYRVKSLPFCETETFQLRFDPASVAINLVQIHVHAIVIIPSLTLSTYLLEFDSILCGQCQVKNFQIYNHVQVVCEWVLTEEEKPKLIDKHMPLHLRRKAKIKTKPSQQVFELLPSSGVLLPGERINVQVKFSPTKEKLYTESIFLRISQSKERQKLTVQGKGLELHLDFCPSVLEFVPILPYSNGDKIEVTVKNPCTYPIEFYSLEFDKQYHEEEKILRLLKGYDSENILLFPPRNPGEKLPPEILEYYEDWKKGQEEQGIQEEGNSQMTDILSVKQHKQKQIYAFSKTFFMVQMSELSSSSRVGEIDAAPVAKAIARHLGMDVSPEANAAKNRRGITIIVHGAPVSGKTNTALTLAKHYGTPCLSINSIILEALESGSTAAGLQARELCAKAAVELAQKKAEEAGVNLCIDYIITVNISASFQKQHSSEHPVSVASTPVHPMFPQQKLSVSTSVAGEMELVSCLLPDDVMVDILSERLQLNDCSRGVVFDSLETLYCRSLANALGVVLKAINDRKYIFMIDLKHDYASLKAREKAKKDAEGRGQETQNLKDLKVKKLPEKTEKQKMDAKLKKKGKKGKKDDIASGKKPLTTVKMVSTVSARSEAKGEHPGGEKKYSVPDSMAADHREGEEGGKKRKGKEIKIELPDIYTSGTESTEDSEKGQLSDSEKQLIQRFKLYEQNQKNIAEILECWDRSQGITVCLPVQEDNVQEMEETATVEQRPATAGKKGKKDKEKEKLEKEKEKEKERLEKEKMDKQKVLDGMGLGPSGPPIPPPFILSVVRYPMKRTSLGNQNALEHFAFLAPSTEEIIEEKKLIESETETLASSSVKVGPPFNSLKHLSLKAWFSLLSCIIFFLCIMFSRLTTFRWIIPAYGKVSLIIQFTSDVLGCFEQMLNFEIMGMSKLYQLSCKGICAFPAVCKDPTIVFANHKKKPMPNEIIHKKFITATDVYQFGPLLCGKNRERFKEGRYPENMEKILVQNSTALNIDIHFSFLHDTKATTFLMDPPMLSLKPNESQMLTIWAYPTSSGLFEDAVVFCIKENPEPLVFKISCQGVRPELELDRKQLHFDKILLHRRETKTLNLRNHSLLPVAWKLTGLENLGDEFSVSQDHGVVLPKSEYALQMYFRAQKQINLKKVIRLEVSDAESILGIVYTENIQIFAEAYDVTLDVSFPKDGGLDFGVIKVMEEAKQVISLKNKGKYEIAFCFLLDATEPEMPELKSLFTIQPLKGTLNPNEKALQVHINFQSTKEVCIKNKPVLHCQVIEPNVCIGGETIFSIPVKLSIQSVFSKYICVPANELNFGAIMYGSRRTRTFSIENKGELEIRFMLSMMSGEPTLQPLRRSKRGRSHEGSVSGRSGSLSKARRSDSVLQKEMGSALARITVGEFTISPGFGIIPIGAQQVITVDCVVEQVGKRQETLSIDISDRDPEDHPAGIPYHLVVEGCVPVNDIPSIFEEHRICKNVNLYQCLQTIAFGGIFVEDENRFIFVNTLVGQQAKAQFKIINAGKIPCDVSLSVKPITSKPGFKIAEIFELEQSRMIILSHSHSFAVVTFSPQSMQCYQCIFEASIEGNFSNIPRPKSLVFDIIGEGNLPQITVVRPAIRTRIGNPLILFSRLLLEHTEKHQLVLKNDGTIPAEVRWRTLICVVFSLLFINILVSENNTHAASLILSPGQSAEFGIFFTPSTVQRYCGSVHIMVVDNQYEDCVVQLVGEGYQDEITLDNICIPKGSEKMEISEAPVDQDTVEANRSDHIYYGDCHVGKPYQETFTMTNRSNADSMRFEWLSDIPQLKFFPQIGHVHAGCTKNVTITFHSDQPITLSAQIVKCKVTKIVFQQPVDQVPDWDTRMRTVKWLDATRESEIQRTTKKKVIETDSEPAHTVLENTTRELELRVSAVCDYAQFSCKSETIHFKDTLLFQTRVFELSISNTGCVQLQYSWQTTMEANGRTIILNDRTGSRSLSHPTSTLESVSTMMSAESELPPFNIEPIAGVIDPEEQQVFVIKFSPLELGEFEGEISCSIPNLKNTQGPAMTVKGRSLLPNCHFDLEDSDYIRSNRRNPDMKGPRGAPPRATLDANTRVIEFFSVGIKRTVSRTFTIMNPTSAPYTFQWRCDDQDDLKVQPAFKCLAEKGTVNSQKKTEITFEFLPQNLEITESFWSFVIHEQNITLPFLLVGKAREPVVSLDRSHLNYKSLAVGLHAQQTVYLVNNEDTSFFFSFQEDSLHSEGFVYSLIVHPMEGSIHPQSSLPVIISFKPTHEGKVNFNLQCNIKRKTQPLTLHVKAEVYYMNVSVQYENSEGILTDLSLDMENNICFGQVGYNEESAFHFLISNTGTYNLDFIWEICGPDDVLQFLKINPLKDKVLPGVQIQSTLTFCPKQFCVIKSTGLCLKILNGPTFNCVLEGSAVTPGIHFSFTKHDFGLNFIYYAGMVPSTQKLCITNKGDKEARAETSICLTKLIECLFTSTSYLEVACQTEILQPSGVLEVPITFHPREPIKYHEKVIFQINKFTQQIVEILGQGAEMKIEVEDPNHKSINLGALQVGETVTKVIPVVNKSRISLSFFLPNICLMSLALWVSPSGDITLNPSGGRCMVEVVFSPTCRIPPFIEEVMMDSTGIRRSLFVVRGSCQGMEIILDQDYIPFGAVAQRSQATRRLLMQNTGDIGTRFKWNINSFLPDFSIYPDQGYITPGMEIPFEVTFSPKELNQEIRYENLCCSIEGGKTFKLILTGSCVSATIKEVINFSCHVRGRQSQTVVLPNKTVQPWVLHPIIEGEYWSGPQSFTIEAQQSKPYEITYRPLTMTTEGKKHQGSVFFPFPDGTGQLHMLQGTADPPKPVSTISREVPCKTSYSEMLSVSNWLAKPQRFRVCIEIMKPEKIDITTELKGLDYVDVPASAKRDYKLTFFSYKEGVVQAKVIFQNETNQEYLYYILNFKATPPSAISSIEMVTVVRQSTSATVKVENPLPFSTSFIVDCKQSDITFPAQLNIPPESEGALMFEYQPLKAGDFTGRLTLLNSDLGAFHYDLILKALPASPEKPLYFRAMLGSSQLQVARFINYCKPKVEFICKSDSPDFSVEKSFSVQPGTPVGTEVGVDVCFEPCHLGESPGLLTIHSSVGGDYIFPLFGTSLTPKAQGPIIVRAGSNTSIPFKNVFLQNTTFSFQVDNPFFSVKPSETIPSKKTKNISVFFGSNPTGSKAPVPGKMTVSCPRSEGSGQIISWVYYLKGHTP
uniref:HYDIN axonemal central pair apparatus protein n=1 Tax=Erpetoichthys calabaricus TaxID=27687 RepID=A0A8C4S4T7_ERPCA